MPRYLIWPPATEKGRSAPTPPSRVSAFQELRQPGRKSRRSGGRRQLQHHYALGRHGIWTRRTQLLPVDSGSGEFGRLDLQRGQRRHAHSFPRAVNIRDGWAGVGGPGRVGLPTPKQPKRLTAIAGLRRLLLGSHRSSRRASRIRPLYRFTRKQKGIIDTHFARPYAKLSLEFRWL
jgi:hypothetical protein